MDLLSMEELNKLKLEQSNLKEILTEAKKELRDARREVSKGRFIYITRASEMAFLIELVQIRPSWNPRKSLIVIAECPNLIDHAVTADDLVKMAEDAGIPLECRISTRGEVPKQ